MGAVPVTAWASLQALPGRSRALKLQVSSLFPQSQSKMKTFSSQKRKDEHEFPSVLSQHKQAERKKNSKIESMIFALFHPAALLLPED